MTVGTVPVVIWEMGILGNGGMMRLGEIAEIDREDETGKSERLPASFCGADVKLSVEGAFRIVEDMVTEHMGDLRIDRVTCMREYGGMWMFAEN